MEDKTWNNLGAATCVASPSKLLQILSGSHGFAKEAWGHVRAQGDESLSDFGPHTVQDRSKRGRGVKWVYA
jgi:hypothetical protein